MGRPGSARRRDEPAAVLEVLPANEECLRELQKANVDFRRAPPTRGVQTPVIVRGKLAGVSFWANDKRPLLLDCRLALALSRLEPVFSRLGVSRARFSGAYVMKSTRTGRLSHHAYGLAIDIHELTIEGEDIAVEGGFLKGRGCDRRGSKLNRLACELKASGYFEELLTPDYNYDHRDHFHVAVPLKVRGPADQKNARLATRQ
jgi:hypothetical protein